MHSLTELTVVGEHQDLALPCVEAHASVEGFRKTTSTAMMQNDGENKLVGLWSGSRAEAVEIGEGFREHLMTLYDSTTAKTTQKRGQNR